MVLFFLHMTEGQSDEVMRLDRFIIIITEYKKEKKEGGNRKNEDQE